MQCTSARDESAYLAHVSVTGLLSFSRLEWEKNGGEGTINPLNNCGRSFAAYTFLFPIFQIPQNCIGSEISRRLGKTPNIVTPETFFPPSSPLPLIFFFFFLSYMVSSSAIRPCEGNDRAISDNAVTTFNRRFSCPICCLPYPRIQKYILLRRISSTIVRRS